MATDSFLHHRKPKFFIEPAENAAKKRSAINWQNPGAVYATITRLVQGYTPLYCCISEDCGAPSASDTAKGTSSEMEKEASIRARSG